MSIRVDPVLIRGSVGIVPQAVLIVRFPFFGAVTMILRVFRSAWATIWPPIAGFARSLVPTPQRGAMALVLALVLAFGWGVSQGAVAQFRPGTGSTGSVSVRTRWEYRSISTSEASDPGNANFFRDLSDLGDEGFEMVTCLYAQERRDENSTTVCYFKRPQ
jgi:hypothetical protein